MYVLVVVAIVALAAPILLTVPFVFADQADCVPAVLSGITTIAAIVTPVFAAVLPPLHSISRCNQ